VKSFASVIGLFMLSCGPPAPVPTPEPTPEPETPVACNAVEVTERSLVARARATADKRIVGGEPAVNAPWMVAILDGSFQYCGGTLITPDTVLTAAHCNVQPGDSVFMGSTDLSQGGQHIGITKVKSHGDYNSVLSSNDIALVFLERDVVFDPASVSLGAPTVGDPVTAFGWGFTAEGGPATNILQEVTVSVVDPNECQKVYGNIDRDIMVCAGVPEGGKDACQGDSGGPLMNRFDSVVGITSFGFGCARPGVPGVYTRADSFVDWIESCLVE
jgi:secreted trypsin-like serine protease